MSARSAAVLTLAEHLKRTVSVVLADPSGVANWARLFHGLIPLLYQKPPVLLLAEVELCDSRGFGRLFVRCVNVTKVLGASSEDGDAPCPLLRSGGLLFQGRGHAQ